MRWGLSGGGGFGKDLGGGGELPAPRARGRVLKGPRPSKGKLKPGKKRENGPNSAPKRRPREASALMAQGACIGNCAGDGTGTMGRSLASHFVHRRDAEWLPA